MGEYATRFSDNQEVKIGTRENMYYLRFEDKHKVSYDCFSPGLRYRIPLPAEDGELPGGYFDFSYEPSCPLLGMTAPEDAEAGTVQLRHDCGLLANVKCHHGAKLPTNNKDEDIQFFWNGKTTAFCHLAFIKHQDDGLLWPVIRCSACRNMWRAEWNDVLPHVHDRILRGRLEFYSKLTPKKVSAAKLKTPWS
jgi:hypothetical protein